MKKRLLLFAHDPGGANVVASLVEALNIHNFEVLLYGKGPALDRYKNLEVNGGAFIFSDEQNLKGQLARFLDVISPACIITGTSAQDLTEKYLWEIAAKKGIPSLAILDQWMNYGVRFSPYKVSELALYVKNKIHTFLPTFILVMDELAKENLIDEGVPVSCIKVVGHPYFEKLYKDKDKGKAGNRQLVRTFLGIKEEVLVTFASEPISLYGGESILGYNEISILRSLIEVLDNVSTLSNKKVKLIVRPHPREDSDNLKLLCESSSFQNLSCSVDKTTPSLSLIKASDLVCGMSSMFLLEATVLQIPIMSIQIGLKGVNPFVLEQKGLMNSIVTVQMLERALYSFMQAREIKPIVMDLPGNPVKNIIQQIQSLL